MPSIGILAYGSLRVNPGVEIKTAEIGRVPNVMTPDKIEYARSSSSRGGAPTLVPYDEADHVSAEIIVVDVPPQEAKNMLYRREIDQVGDLTRVYGHPTTIGPNTVVIDTHPKLGGIDIVLSTRLAANISPPLTAKALASLAIKSAKDLAVRARNRDGISYLRDNIALGVITLRTRDYEQAILQKLGAKDLDDALTKC